MKNPSNVIGSRAARFASLRVVMVLCAVLAFAGLGVAPAGNGGFDWLSMRKASAQSKAASAPEAAGQAQEPGITLGTSYHNDTSPRLRDVEQVPVKLNELEFGQSTKTQETVTARDTDPGALLVAGIFPVTDGEVGATQRVKIVKRSYQIFDNRSGASLLGPSDISTVWAGFGGSCETGGAGDAVVLYDKVADRWIISQFASATSGQAATEECFAVSTTSDATGSYYRYAFHLGGHFIDFPHLTAQSDGYLMGDSIYSESGTERLGTQFFLFDRTTMLAGSAATFTSPGIDTGVGETYSISADGVRLVSESDSPAVTTLTINLTYASDATFTSAGLSAADILNMKAANTYAASQFTNNFRDPINVNISVTAVPGTSTLGGSNTSIFIQSFTTGIRDPTRADATSTDDATMAGASGSVPAGLADPISGTHNWWVTKAQRKALKIAADDLTTDGTYTFGGGFAYTYDPNNRAVAGKYDYIGVSMHEFSEIMGRLFGLGRSLSGNPGYLQMDLFHYTGANTRSLTNGAGRSFSFNNGTSLLKAFNNAVVDPGTDPQDWASGTNDSFNARSNPGVKNDLTAVDLQAMDVIGYDKADYLAAPTLIAPANGSTGQSTQPTFNWTAVSGATSYRIMVATNPSDLPTDPNSSTGGPTVVINDTPAGTSYVPSTALNPGTTYYWEAHARGNPSPGYWSSIWSFTTAGGVPPAPTANSATNVTTSGFTANWNSASGATGYRLDVSTSSTFSSYVSGYQDLNVGNVTNRSVTGLSAATSYYYRVRAYNGNGTSGNSNVINQATNPNPPGAPTATPATSVTSSSFTANWNSSSGATGYRLDVSTSSSFGSFVSGYQDLDVGNVLNRSVTGLSAATTYFYRVRAYNGGGSSGSSNIINVTTTGNPPPVPTATAATNVTSSSFTANWSSSSGATGYRLDVSTSSSFGSFVSGYQNLDVGNVLTRNVTGLSAATTYYYRVRAYNGGGTSGDSNIINVTTSGGGGLPDLVVTSLTAPTTGGIGGQITVSTTTSNQGSANAGAFRLGFYLSTDNIITTGDTFTGWSCDYSSGLAAGTAGTCSGSIGIPSSLSPGTYYLGAIADDLGVIAEGNESNNARAADTGPIVLRLGTCASPYALVSGQPFNGDTSGGQSNFGSYSCVNWSESGPERVHAITLAAAGTLTATLSNLGANDLDVFILTSCSSASCLAFGDNEASANVGPGTYYIVVDGFQGAVGGYTLTIRKTPFDFDGDVKADIAVQRPSDRTWWILNSSTGSYSVQQWGFAGDKVVPADYDGDGKTDIAIWRPSNGTWWILNSSTGTYRVQQWGFSTDVPVPGDYDGDGKADTAVFRPSDRTWWILNSSTGTITVQQWGLAGDVPVPGDYDGDGKTDIAIQRPSDGTWWILNSSTGIYRSQQWGAAGDKLVPADYDGDGKTDIAIWRPSNGTWWILNSSTGTYSVQQWGFSSDIPVAADYDGDGKADTAVFRPSDRTWWILNSSTGGITVQQWGLSGDIPLPSVYVP